MNTKAIPTRLARRPRDERGFPIPYAQYVDEAGAPDFRVLDGARTAECLSSRRCGLCGEALGAHIFFIGGPASAASGLFYDPPMHRDCAFFAIATCPHLARSKGRYAKEPAGNGLVSRGIDTDKKAEAFALLHTKAYETVSEKRTGGLVIRAQLPWLDISWWKDGRQVEAPKDYPQE